MRTTQHYLDLLDRNPNASVGFTLAAAAIYAARYGVCEAEHHSTTEFRNIARELRAVYGESLTANEVRAEMDTGLGATAGEQSRDYTFRVRLTNAERIDLDRRAADAGQDRSEYVRRLLWPHESE